MMWRAQRQAVLAAQAEVDAQHAALATPAAQLATRIKTHPLTSLGLVAGLGFVFGTLHLPRATTSGTGGWLRDGALELAALWLRSAGQARSSDDQTAVSKSDPLAE